MSHAKKQRAGSNAAKAKAKRFVIMRFSVVEGWVESRRADYATAKGEIKRERKLFLWGIRLSLRGAVNASSFGGRF